MLEVEISFIWMALSYIIIRLMLKNPDHKPFLEYLGFAINNLLALTYAIAVDKGKSVASILTAFAVVNFVLYFWIFIIENVHLTTKRAIEKTQHFIKRLNY